MTLVHDAVLQIAIESQSNCAMLYNLEARRKNRIIHEAHNPTQNIVVLRKVNRGFMLNLSADIPQNMVDVALTRFRKISQIFTFSLVSIFYSWANDDLGILPDDTLAVCKDTFLSFILW